MPHIPHSPLAIVCLGLFLTLAAPVHAQSIDFGDDSSMWANDGECDDPRFQGSGMATTLLDSDIRRDATDCRLGVEAGRLRVLDTAGGTASGGKTVDGVAEDIQAQSIDFGDDSSMWANDGECDDPRFQGSGMATTLLDSDIRRDATDCRLGVEAGRLRVLDTAGGTASGGKTVDGVAEDIQASTADGSIVNLHSDGTWTPVQSQTPQSSGMVNLTLTRLEDSYGTCKVHMQYDNNTSVFFDDYAAEIFVLDVNGYSVADGCGVGMENLRPGSIATCEMYVQNVSCSEIGTVAVAGWQYCIVEGERDSSGRLCDPYLNIAPSRVGVPLLRR
ncbi:hypothetical protein OAD19_02200 [Octadecabacter sp.]|nr:hypothetical protein [Octadecabacter sp.]